MEDLVAVGTMPQYLLYQLEVLHHVVATDGLALVAVMLESQLEAVG